MMRHFPIFNSSQRHGVTTVTLRHYYSIHTSHSNDTIIIFWSAPTSQDILVIFEWLESSSPSSNETFEDKKVGKPSVRVSVQLFNWQPTKISFVSFKPTKVSLVSSGFGVVDQNIHFASWPLSARWPPLLCLFSTSLKWETMPT